MINKVSTELCCGCAACYDSCPTGAIIFKHGDCGFLYPQVIEENCLSCGKCLSVCGAYLDGTPVDKSSVGLFAAKNKDDKVLQKSSSGGVFTTIAQSVLADGGVVISAELDRNLSLNHVVISDEKDLNRVRGSKYIQSNTQGIYKQTKKMLDLGTLTMFVGTPCQVRALKLFLKADYDNLISVDVICHGVPSQDFFDKYVSYLSKKYRSCVKSVDFRNKNVGWKNFCVKIVLDNGKVIYENLENNLYMRLFLKNYSLRKSCYNCRANNYRSGSDITLGDFWNIEKIDSEFSDDKGTSAVMINTSKGMEVFDKIKNNLKFKEQELEYLVKNNHVLERSVSLPPCKEQFAKNYKLQNIDKIDDLCLCQSYIGRIKKRIKRVLRGIK